MTLTSPTFKMMITEFEERIQYRWTLIDAGKMLGATPSTIMAHCTDYQHHPAPANT